MFIRGFISATLILALATWQTPAEEALDGVEVFYLALPLIMLKIMTAEPKLFKKNPPKSQKENISQKHTR
jgi:hypothetical protein